MGEPLISVGSGVPGAELEEGTYRAVCVGLKKVVINSEYGQNQQMYEWHFEIPLEEDPDNPIPVQGLTNQQFNGPQSKTYQYMNALPGKLEQGQQFSEEDFIGKPCLIEIGFNKRGWPTVRNVIAAPRGAAGATPVQRPAQEGDGSRPSRTDANAAANAPAA